MGGAVHAGARGLGDLLDRLPEEVSDGLSTPQRQAVQSALLLSPTSDAPVDLEALPRAVLALLRRLSAEGPVVLAIDDEHWLDRPSARVLGFALRRLRDERVGVILTRRTDSSGALWPELARGFGQATMFTAVLGPLGVGVLDRLLESGLNGTLSRALLRRVSEASSPTSRRSIASSACARARSSSRACQPLRPRKRSSSRSFVKAGAPSAVTRLSPTPW
jgi:hypothetical protein